MITICVDAMGGDCDPRVVLQGVEAALAKREDLSVLLTGNADIVVPFAADHDRVRALATTQVIAMDEHPAEAIRAKKDSSIVRGCEACAQGEAQGFFSAGSTGAIFAAATLYTGRIRGIKRPAIATGVPGITGRRTVVLDLGANADVRPEMLVQFAQMGRAFSRTTLGVSNPKVALLNNGEERTKGSEGALAAFAALEQAAGGVAKKSTVLESNQQLQTNGKTSISQDETNTVASWFCGNCEGTDILAGVYDVIVTDGFTGNIALKTLEGTAKYIMAAVKQQVAVSRRAAAGALLLKPALKEVAASLSGDEYGGACLLGVKAPVFIGHGSTSVEAIMHGTLVAAEAVEQNLIEKIAQEI